MFVVIMFIIIFFGCLYGYVRNIFMIFTTLSEPRGNATNFVVLVRMIGIFIPVLGILLGFMGAE